MSKSKYHLRLPSRTWEAFRQKILKRDNWTCRRCQRYGNEVDHIIPLADGGAALDADNVQVLCTGCHIRKTRAENSRPEIPGRREWLALLNSRP